MDPMDPEIVIFVGSMAFAISLGTAFVVMWRLCVPRGATRGMLAELIAITTALAKVDEIDRFLALYKRLIVRVGGYVLRNTGGLALASLPMIAALLLLAPPVLDAWGRRADGVVLYPPMSESSGSEAVVAGTGGASRTLTVGEAVVDIGPAWGRTAVCWSPGYCMLFDLLGFDLHETPEALVESAPFLVLRPDHGDDNFLWPYLSDLEFDFFVAFMLASMVIFLLPQRPRRGTEKAG